MKQEKRIRKIVYKNLNDIVRTAKSIANDWDKKTIPLSTLQTIISKTKPSEKTGDKELDVFNVQYNKTLDSLYGGCLKLAAKMNSTDVPISEIERGVGIIKIAFA